MFKNLFYLFIFLPIQKVSLQNDDAADSYRAAVVQYYPFRIAGDEYADAHMVHVNTNQFISIISTASSKGVDIIVFPEYGLTGMPKFEKPYYTYLYKGSDKEEYQTAKNSSLKDFSSKAQNIKYHEESPVALKYRKAFASTAVSNIYYNSTPCTLPDTRENLRYIKSISCAARKFKIYVVINHYEKQICGTHPGCPSDGFLLFNTNTVFDRQGTVIARDYKFNVFYEPWADRQPFFHISPFTTDFHVTFAGMIGYDINIKHMPGVFKAQQVTDAFLTTSVENNALFFNSVQDYSFWAYKSNMNLLAAGFSRDGSSEIFFAEQMAKEGMFDYFKGVATLHTGLIAKNRSGDRDAANVYARTYKNYEKLPVYDDGKFPPKEKYKFFQSPGEFWNVMRTGDLNSRLLDIQDSPFNLRHELCIHKLCCNFDIAARRRKRRHAFKYNYYSYRAVVYRNIYKLRNDSLAATEVCAIVACNGKHLMNCGETFSDKVDTIIFDRISIFREFNSTNVMQLVSPVTVTHDNNVMLSAGYDYDINVHEDDLTMHSKRELRHVYLFGVNVKSFDVDEWIEESIFNSNRFRWTVAGIALVGTIILVVMALCLGKKLPDRAPIVNAPAHNGHAINVPEARPEYVY